MRPRQAVILIGGKGTRLGELTKDYPKPLLEVGGRPFLDRVMAWLVQHGIDHIILLAGHAAQVVQELYSEPEILGARLDVRIEASPRGTAGALHEAVDLLDDQFLLLNGDSIFAFDLSGFLETGLLDGCGAHVALRRVPDIARFGSVSIATPGSASKLTAFGEKSGTGEGLINGGVYHLTRQILEYIPGEGMVSLEQQIFPKLLAEEAMGGEQLEGYFIDIGLPDTLEEAQADLDRNLATKAVFFDRDGVLNHDDDGYFFDPAKLRWRDGAIEAVVEATRRGYLTLVVTNQGGVGKGLYTEDDVKKLHDVMQADIRRAGGNMTCFYHCPYHPNGTVPQYTGDSWNRKPNPGMLEAAAAEFSVLKEKSFLLGDKDSDIAAAEAFGVLGFMVTNQPLLNDLLSAINSVESGA